MLHQYLLHTNTSLYFVCYLKPPNVPKIFLISEPFLINSVVKKDIIQTYSFDLELNKVLFCQSRMNDWINQII